MRPKYDPEFTLSSFLPNEEVLHEFTLPDATKVRLIIEHIQVPGIKAGCFSFDRDCQPSGLTGQGHAFEIFNRLMAFMKGYMVWAKLDYVFFGGPAKENREPLYHKLMEMVLQGTRFRYVEDPWDDINRVHSGLLDFLNMVENQDVKLFVLKRI